ncbi:MAG: hypothetical protein ACO38I_10400, partial [Ilumatobacteraceae bacterium]
EYSTIDATGDTRLPPTGMSDYTLAQRDDLYTVTASSELNVNNLAWLAFDHNAPPSEGWTCAGGLFDPDSGAYNGTVQLSTNSLPGEWISFTSKRRFALSRVEIAPWYNNMELAPLKVQVLGQRPDSGWDLLADPSDLAWRYVAEAQTQLVEVRSLHEYHAYALVFNKIAGANTSGIPNISRVVRLSEIRLFKRSVRPDWSGESRDMLPVLTSVTQTVADRGTYRVVASGELSGADTVLNAIDGSANNWRSPALYSLTGGYTGTQVLDGIVATAGEYILLEFPMSFRPGAVIVGYDTTNLSEQPDQFEVFGFDDRRWIKLADVTFAIADPNTSTRRIDLAAEGKYSELALVVKHVVGDGVGNVAARIRSLQVAAWSDPQSASAYSLPNLGTEHTVTANGVFSAIASSFSLGNPAYYAFRDINMWGSAAGMYNTGTGAYEGAASFDGISGEWLSLTTPRTVFSNGVRIVCDAASGRPKDVDIGILQGSGYVWRSVEMPDSTAPFLDYTTEVPITGIALVIRTIHPGIYSGTHVTRLDARLLTEKPTPVTDFGVIEGPWAYGMVDVGGRPARVPRGYFRHPPIAVPQIDQAAPVEAVTKLGSYFISTNPLLNSNFNHVCKAFNGLTNNNYWRSETGDFDTTSGLYIANEDNTKYANDAATVSGPWAQVKMPAAVAIVALSLQSPDETSDSSTRRGFAKAGPRSFSLLGRSGWTGAADNGWTMIQTWNDTEYAADTLDAYLNERVYYVDAPRSFEEYRFVVFKTMRAGLYPTGTANVYSQLHLAELRLYSTVEDVMAKRCIVDQTSAVYDAIPNPTVTGGALG